MDETIYDYYGRDATLDALYSVMGGKMEHPRGIMSQSLTQRLPLSRLPVVVLWRPRLPGEKLKPTSALVSCVETLVSLTKEPHHVYADSAFAGTTSINSLRALYHSTGTFSFNQSFGSGMVKLYDVVSQDLPIHKVISIHLFFFYFFPYTNIAK